MKGRAKESTRNGIIVGIITLIVVAVVILTRLSGRTIENEEGAIGNSACNLYNGGLFCEDEERIYFSNLKDGGALYSMSKDLTDFEYVYEDTAGYINSTNAYLVYSRLNYTRSDSVKHVLQFSSSGLYRLNKKGGNNIKSLYYSNIGLATLIGNDVYYQKLEKKGGLKLYHTTLSSKKGSLLLEKNIIPGSLEGDRLYYSGTGNNHYIYYLNRKTGTEHEFYKGNCYHPALVGENMYFISASQGYKIARIDRQGKNPTLLVKERCSFYNVSEDERYLVYQVDGGKENRLEVLDLLNLEKKRIKMGDYNGIHIIGNRVFFREFGTDEVYFFEFGKFGEVKIFNPPDLTENKETKGV